MWRHLCLVTAAWALAPPKINLGDYLVQRAVQQQLNYMADLKNEPLGNWLKAFQSHEHLDSRSPRRFRASWASAVVRRGRKERRRAHLERRQARQRV